LNKSFLEKGKHMNKKAKLSLCLGAVVLLASGCGSTYTTVSGGNKPVITVVGGYSGYYTGTRFCSWNNNYCGTGVNWGISPPVVIYNNGYYGYYNNNIFCNFSNNYCNSGISWGIINNGTYCDYTYCGGTISYSSGSTGGYTGSTGGTSGSTGGYTGSTGGTSGSTGGYTGSTGGTSGSTGGYTGSTGGYTGSTGGYTGSTGGYTGSTGGYTGSTGGYTGSTGGYTGSTGGYTGSTGSTSTSTGSYSGSTGSTGSTGGYSVDGSVKDVDLQRAQQQIADIQSRAQAVASQFQMSVSSAVQLTQLSDRMNTLSSNGLQMTDEDRAALSEAALNVAGISMDDAKNAATNAIKGDKTAVNSLIEKAAANLGMSSSATLRTQILPSLGINLQ
jgi:hypothetical protein